MPPIADSPAPSSPPARPRRAWLVLAAFGLALGAAVWPRLPAVVPATAAPVAVSGERAMAVLAQFAAVPREAGSPALAQARARIVAELAASGLAAEERQGVFGRRLVNVLAPIAGTDPTGTVLLLAHYDSVPGCPGAGDDGVGVVCWLEALRALRAAGWQPRNDVLLLLTDGEEDGLLGAHLFARTDPRVAKVKAIVNLEAIGNGGPAYLFELGPRNGGKVELFASAVARPAGSSFAEAVYHALPNDTDLSVFLKRGAQGFNLALTWGSCAYHAPHDTPANLDPRSVQHMAQAAATLARGLGDADLRTLPAPSESFFDLLGVVVVRWPQAWDAWLAAAAALLAVALAARSGAGVRALAGEAARHLAGVVGVLVGVVGLCWLGERLLAGLLSPPSWVAGNTTSAALLFVGAAALATAAALPRVDAMPVRVAARRAVAALLWSAFGVAASVWLPGAAFVFTWPVLVVGLPALWTALRPARGAADRGTTTAGLLLPALAAALLGLPPLHVLTQLMAREPLVALGLVIAVVASAARLLAAPLHALAVAPAPRRLLWAVAAAALAGSATVAVGLGWRGGALWP